MALTYGFFDAELVQGQYDRVYNAAEFAQYFSLLIKNGVFPDPSTNLQVKASSPTANMNVNIEAGYGWINGYWAKNDSPYTLTIQPAHGSLNRIDAVVLRWVSSTRSMEFDVLTGTPNASPQIPNLTRTVEIYELMLASITVANGATSIAQASITDKRPDSSVCGWVTSLIENIDTTDLFAQFEDAFKTWFDNIKGQLEGDVVANLQRQIDERVKIKDKATEEEVITGTDDTKWVTPKALSAITKNIGTSIYDNATGKNIKIETEYSDTDIFGYLYTDKSYGNNYISWAGSTCIVDFDNKKLYIIAIRFNTVNSNTKNKFGIITLDYTSFSSMESLSISESRNFKSIKDNVDTDYSYHTNYKIYFSVNGPIIDAYLQNNDYFLINAVSGSFLHYKNYNVHQAFRGNSYWGYLSLDSNTYKVQVVKGANNASPSSVIDIMTYSYSNNYINYVTIIGIKDDLLYLIVPFPNDVNNEILMEVNLINSNVTTKLNLNGSSYKIIPVCFSDTKAYMLMQTTVISGEIKEKIFWYDFTNNTSNWEEAKGSDSSIPGPHEANTFNIIYYGTVDNTIYAGNLSKGIIYEINKTSNNVSVVYLSESLFPPGYTISGGVYNHSSDMSYGKKEKVFNIPGYPGIILVGALIFDTKSYKVYLIQSKKAADFDNTRQFMEYIDGPFKNPTCQFIGSNITDINFLGFGSIEFDSFLGSSSTYKKAKAMYGKNIGKILKLYREGE